MKNISHLFSKIVVMFCILVITTFAAFCLYAQAKGANMTGLYIAIAGTFIAELVLLMLKAILQRKQPSNIYTEADTETHTIGFEIEQ